MIDKKAIKSFAPNGYIYDENGELFYYKLVDEKNYGIEVIMSVLANEVGINCARYHIVSNGNKSYYISPDIAENGIFFLAGELGIEDISDIKEVEKVIKTFFYKSQDSIVRDLYKVYFFDILFMNNDRSSGNYGIKDSNDKAKLYILDNENVFCSHSEVVLTYCGIDNYQFDGLLDLNYLIENDSKYNDMFLDMYKRLNPSLVVEVINRVELGYGHKLKDKEKIIKRYIDNYEKVGYILNKNNIVLNKKVTI